MYKLMAVCVLVVAVSQAFADPIDLPLRTEDKVARGKLKVAKHTQDGQTYLAFIVPTKGNDANVDGLALISFAQQAAAIASIKDALTKMTKANNAAKNVESSEALWSPNDNLSLTLFVQTKTPKAFVELRVEASVFVLRTSSDFEKLIAAIKAVK